MSKHSSRSIKGHLYFGDNLDVLHEYVRDESVDLIYLDPPFNSQAQYNVLFQTPKKDIESAQAQAFRDTWTWNEETEWAFKKIMETGGGSARFIEALRGALGESDMMAYLVMMAVRLEALHRKLKPTGSLFLHCDQTASHYLKVVLDGIFGPRRFLNEILWKRRVGMSSAVHDSNRFGVITDTILLYAKGPENKFHPQYNLKDPDYQRYIEQRFTYKDEATGRLFQPTSLVNPAYRPNLIYDYKGYKPAPNGWMITKEKMEQWDREGRLYFPKDKNGRIRRKSFADELRGMPIQNLWTDIPEINSQAQERLGYPTQKPLALLERIIACASDEGDVVLDPFCGCGTTIEAAEKSKRCWIGIDVAVHAVKVIEARLADLQEKTGREIAYRSEGTRRDQGGSHPFARFGDGLVGQADDGESGQPRRDLNLDIDGTRLDAFEGHGRDMLNHLCHPAGRSWWNFTLLTDQRKNIKRTKRNCVTGKTQASMGARVTFPAMRSGIFGRSLSPKTCGKRISSMSKPAVGIAMVSLAVLGP